MKDEIDHLRDDVKILRGDQFLYLNELKDERQRVSRLREERKTTEKEFIRMRDILE